MGKIVNNLLKNIDEEFTLFLKLSKVMYFFQEKGILFNNRTLNQHRWTGGVH